MPKLPVNPCPTKFRYLFDGQNWLGSITVPSPAESLGVANLHVNFSVEGILPNETSLSMDDYNVDNLIHKIRTGQPLTYTVKFAKHTHVPSVTLIKLNNDILCSGPPALTTSWLEMQHNARWWTEIINTPQVENRHPSLSPQFPEIDNSIPAYNITPLTKLKNFVNSRKCGTISKPFFDRIGYGEEPLPDSHPWMAAFFDFSNRKVTFFCAGNLISAKHILTAAHCIRNKDINKIQAGLGIHNVKDLQDPSIQFRSISAGIIHPDFKNQSDADIAFIVLNYEVEFTSSIKPICMWNYLRNFESIIEYTGVIMGWGLNENEELSERILETNVTITSKENCRRNNLLRNLITDHTFCAGNPGTGPCSGDSGGGLFLNMDGKWYIRGIISMAIADMYNNVCDFDSYAVYVDVAQYKEWIVTKMDYYT